MESLDGKVAVITGGASGIGAALAWAMAAEGAGVVLADRDEAGLAAVVDALTAAGHDAVGVPTDVTDLSAVEALADAASAWRGAVDVVCNNAGVAMGGPVQTHTHEQWRWITDVNVWGVVHGVEVFVPRLLAAGRPAHIVNTSSFAGLVPNHLIAAYCMTKYAVMGLSECLARELKPAGIGVSVLCPMIVDTPLPATSARTRPRGPEDMDDFSEQATVTRGIDPAEVARIVVRGIRENQLYLVTHPEARGPVQRRFARIDAAFDWLDSITPG
jgi:NAD(P)-dependent dehydrogenase (short-subunit alcohol dehydrogenase family)